MILSKKYLSQRANENIYKYANNRQNIITANAKLAEKMDIKRNQIVKKFDVFLSHSSLDEELVLALVNIFNDSRYSVYVDWIEDTQLNRSQVTRDTAALLRERMENSKGLAYVATTNITLSKWCPWELGYFDGNNKGRCCILPIVEEGEFKGQEYLGLYPYLEYSKIKGKDKWDFWVCEQAPNKYIILHEWLEGKEPCEH